MGTQFPPVNTSSGREKLTIGLGDKVGLKVMVRHVAYWLRLRFGQAYGELLYVKIIS